MRKALAFVVATVALAFTIPVLTPQPAEASIVATSSLRVVTGDGQRALLITSGGWTTSSDLRGVNILTGQRLSQCGPSTCWVNTTFQTITLGQADLGCCNPDGWPNNTSVNIYGQDFGSDTCRRGSASGPTGTVGCSTANVSTIYYYSAGHPPSQLTFWQNVTVKVAMRTDRGDAHIWNLPTLGAPYHAVESGFFDN